jgi:hypothetical protein
MTEQEPTFERRVRAMLAQRAAEVSIPADLAGVVIDRRRRQGRTRLVASAAAVTVVAGGVPAAVQLSHAGATRPVSTASPARPAPACPQVQGRINPKPAAGSERLPAQRHVRGSLGGDAAVVRQVLLVGWAGLQYPATQGDRPATPTLDPATARVQFVERYGDDLVAVVVAADAARHWNQVTWVVRHGRTWQADGNEGMAYQSDAAFDASNGQRFYGDDPLYLVVVTIGCTPAAVVLAPPDSRAEVSTGSDVAADGHVVQPYRPVTLHDGIGVFPVEVQNAAVDIRVLRGGRVAGHRRVSPDGVVQARDWPSSAQLAAALKDAPGTVDPDRARDAFNWMLYSLRAYPLGRPEVIWGGRLPNGQSIVLAANVFASGARYLADQHGLAGGGTGSQLQGVLPANALDHRVITWRVDSGALVVVAPRGARAEAVLGNGGTVPVPLTGGGGVLANGSQVKSVRVYDADGGLIEQRAPNTGLLDLPGTM